MKRLEQELQSFLKQEKVKNQLDFIIQDSNNHLSSIQLVNEFKKHLIEMSEGGNGYGDIGIQFGVWLLSSGYPINTSKGVIKKSN